MLRSLILAACVSCVGLSVQAADEEPTVVRLSLSAVDEPRPALKLLLLPDYADQLPENAAALYYKAMCFEGRDPLADLKNWEKYETWSEMPLDKLPAKEVRDWVAQFRGMLADVERASLCDHCRWFDAIRSEGIYALLPQVQKIRSVARVLRMKARLEIVEGRFDDAIKTLRTGLAMGLHTAQGESLVHGLVGLAIAHTMFDTIDELAGAPGAPNLYWALTSIPRPLVSLRNGLSAERNFLYYTFPELRVMEQQTLSSEEMNGVIKKLHEAIGMANDKSGRFSLADSVATMAWAAKTYPDARKALLDAGRKADDVDKLPVLQVAFIHSVREYETVRDDAMKWLYAPANQAGWYNEVLTNMDAVNEKIKSRHTNPFLAIVPAITAVVRAKMRGETTLDTLRVVEAIRLYAARHDGKLPEKLADITEVPVPLDVFTGKPFRYELKGDTATLELPERPKSAMAGAKRYELTIRK